MSMSAVEVLDWFMENYVNEEVMIGAFKRDYSFVNLLESFTSQEIVDRIEKYETDKNLEDYDEETCKSNCRISAISDSDCADYCDMKCPHIHTDDADKKVEQEFKIGDWVKHKKKGETQQIIEKFDKFVTVKESCGYVIRWKYDDIEHAEPPKEEKQVDKTSNVYRFAKWCYVNGIDFSFMSTDDNPTPKRLQEIIGRYESEKGKPKEEKQKIEKFVKECYGYFPTAQEAYEKINELVDAVNELRGV